MKKEDLQEVAKLLLYKMMQPKRVVGAWKLKDEARQGDDWEKVSVFDLPELTGHVCLAYDDGTITKCSVENGIMQGEYFHYDKSTEGPADPTHHGRTLEAGRYKDGWRVGLWGTSTRLIKKQLEALGMSVSECNLYERHTEGKGKRNVDIIPQTDPACMETLVDLPAPVGVVQMGDHVEERLLPLALVRFRERSWGSKSKKEEKKKEAIPNLNVIPRRGPTPQRGR